MSCIEWYIGIVVPGFQFPIALMYIVCHEEVPGTFKVDLIMVVMPPVATLVQGKSSSLSNAVLWRCWYV